LTFGLSHPQQNRPKLILKGYARSVPRQGKAPFDEFTQTPAPYQSVTIALWDVQLRICITRISENRPANWLWANG
jgi:hypothetical protein